MAPPRQPVVAPPPQPAPADTPTGKIAALPAGELLPLAAIGVAAPVVPAAGAKLTVAATQALAKILAAFAAFELKRKKSAADRLKQTLATLYPERTEDEIDSLVREELIRDVEFQRKQQARLERDLPDALAITDPEKRRQAVQNILKRERRYVQMREQQMAERASARANNITVKAQSPEGAFWLLSDHVKTHTPACIAFANKFWPWEVLDVYHPRIHGGCACSLATKQQAVQLGMLQPDHVVDVKDAVKRATSIANTYEEMDHYHVTEGEIADHIELVYSEPLLVSLAECAAVLEAHLDLRFPKGTVKGGEFMPRAGGDDGGRTIAKRLLRQMIPHRPLTPVEKERIGYGEWKNVGGTHVFVPEYRNWERTLNGRSFSSPAGSTEVYDRGDAKRNVPQIPFERGREITDEMVKARQDNRESASAVATRALADPQLPDRLPVEIGAHSKATHSGLLDAGFQLHRNFIDPSNSEVTNHYVHIPTGAKASVAYGDGAVKRVDWTPGSKPLAAEPLIEGRAPHSFEEFVTDVYSQMKQIAESTGHDFHITRIKTDASLPDHHGFHHWDGTIELGRDIEPAIEQLAQAQREGRDLNFREAGDAYAAIRTAAHEGLHGVNPISQRAFSRPSAKALEEALTDEVSHLVAVDMLRRYGRQDVLQWIKANPVDPKVEGSYSFYRTALGQVFERAGLEPESYRPVVETLKHQIEPDMRLDALAGLVAPDGSTEDHANAVSYIDRTMALSDYTAERSDADEIEFPPLTRADLSDVADTAPVNIDGRPMMPGTIMRVRQPDGRVLPAALIGASPANPEGSNDDSSFLARVRYFDDGRSETITPSMIQDVGPDPVSVSRAADSLSVGGNTFQPGDTISYDRKDGSRSVATVERIVRSKNLDTAVPENGWQIEARTSPVQGESARPGEPILLTADRAPGLRKEAGAGITEGALDKPHKCKFCQDDATKAIVWAEGRAYVPVCDKHVGKGVAAIGGESEVDKMRDLPLREAFEGGLHPRGRGGKWVFKGGASHAGLGSAGSAIQQAIKVSKAVETEHLPDGDTATARLMPSGSVAFHPDSAERTVANAVIHEFGHYLDSHVIGTHAEPGTSTAALDPLYQEMKKSPTMQAVRNDEHEVLKGDAATRNYFLQGREMFARAFHQYVVEHSDDPKLKGELEKLRSDKLIGFQFWQSDEFKPIERELEKVLAAHGLLKD